MSPRSSRPSSALVVAMIVISIAGAQARAETVTLSGVTGVWSNPTATSPAALAAASVSYSASHDRIYWGDPASGAGPSSLLFTAGATPRTFDTGDLFDVGVLTHFNNPIYNAITGATLTVSLSFSDPAGVNGAFPFSFQIIETPNTVDATPDDDFIKFGTTVSSQTFTIGTTEYTLQLLGFRQGGVFVSQFTSPELSMNSATLVGRITSNVNDPVPAEASTPLPTAALAGLTLLGGFGLTTRGRHRKAIA